MTSDSFETHPIFTRLNSLKEILSNTEEKEKIELDKLSFFQSVYDYINQRINLTIPDLVQKAELDGLSSEINAGVTQINSFLGNNNVGHLTNAVNNFNAAIIRIRSFPIPLAKNDYNFSRKVANFEKTVKSKYKSLEKDNKKIEDGLAGFGTELVNKENQIQKLLDLIDGKELEIQNLTSSFKTDFENIKSTHNQAFQNEKISYRKEIDEEKKIFKEELNKLKESIDDNTTNIVSKLNTKLSEAEKLVNIIGNVGVTGNYQNIANNHKSSADFWRYMAIIFMTIFSALLVWTIVDLSSEGFNWIKSMIRLIAAAALSYPATYAARESSKHRNLETINRNAELELASINPFIENLTEERKQLIKEKLAEKYFGNHRDNDSLDEKVVEELSIPALLKILNAASNFKS